MDLFLQVEENLKKLNIPFEIVEHEPAITTEQADSFIEGIEGVRTKTLFLTNNKDKDIKVYIDKEIIDEERMSFHPNTNEKTIFIKTVDLVKFLGNIEYDVNI